MKCSDHVSAGLLVRFADDEVTSDERSAVESHLAACAECRERRDELGLVSADIDTFVASISVEVSDERRRALEQALRRGEQPIRTRRSLVRRVGWGMAIAASLAAGIMFVPRRREPAIYGSGAYVQASALRTFEAAGETFVTMPYSNADLPVNGPHIVQMEVPVSSLLEAGVVFEPISTEAGTLDHSVFADVLLGTDGEPLGVHVVGSE